MAALQLIKKMQQKFSDCEFVVYAKNDEDRSCLNASKNLQIKTLTGKVFFDFEQVFLPLAARQDKVDLLHCTGNTTPFISPVPVVQTLHDVIFMDPISTNDTLYQQFGNRYRRHVVPVVTPKSDAVITVSHYEKERILKRINLDERKIQVIYNGIDEQRFRISDNFESLQSIKDRYRLPQKFVLFLGNMAARKNAPRVIEAYVAYASKVETPIPMVTPGLSEKFISEILEKLNQSEKANLFITPGYIRDEDLPTLYSLSTVFLYPSLSEGFGMPLVEAMACGAPVITSNTSCLPEIAGNAALLVDPSSTSAITNVLLHVLSDEELRRRKITEGLINAKRFSWDKTAEKVYEVYEKVYFKTSKAPAARMAYNA